MKERLAYREDLIFQYPHLSKHNVSKAVCGCITGALVEAKWNISLACELTGLSRQTMYRKMSEFNIKRPS